MEGRAEKKLHCSPPPNTASDGSGSLARQSELDEELTDNVNQATDFKRLLRKGINWKQSFLHKGLVVTLMFLAVMLVGLTLSELLYEDSTGVRSAQNEMKFANTTCSNDMPGCLVVSILRAVGLFGFFGGVTNWIAVEMLFVKIPLIYVSNVIGKHYLMIREVIKRIVVEVLFNPSALDEYLQDVQNNMNKLLNMESVSSILFSDSLVSTIVDKEFEKISSSPEGLQLSLMGIDMNEFDCAMKLYIRELLLDIKPLIFAQMDHSQLLDAVGMQERVELIVHSSLQDMKQDHVRQLVAVMLRKQLSVLIMWGCVFGAIIGLISEAVTIGTLFWFNV